MGGRRTFKVPTADELEKAERGADGRLFPWGNTFDFSLASTYRSSEDKASRSLHYATDQSPYGVRDLAGSLAELTRTDELPPRADPQFESPRYMECRIKGGSAFDDLEPYFHSSGHLRERNYQGSERAGFRLVAYPR